ncbi:MAG: ATP-binding protein [Ignisphaera sp.]|nr:ATP-binding protein [Ignisphaera sp.]MCX8167554.1 ATP-binding protein [Ignisphaera sp.]MDW8086021.1 ATP-binding protein [Ignisphaera sp.]
MQEVGVIASNARISSTPMLIYKNAEHLVKEESLVIVRDSKFGKVYLGVLRWLSKYDPLLTHTQRAAIIERPELAEESIDLPFEASYIRILGEVVDGKLRPPSYPPTPRSKVYIIESSEDIQLDLGYGLEVCIHKYSGLPIPINPEALRYHIAVVGTTGTGKSRLVKAIIDEVIAKTNWSVIVFDHTGMDYVRYYPSRVVNAEEIAVDIDTVSQSLANSISSIKEHIENYMPITLLYYTMCIDTKREIKACLNQNENSILGILQTPTLNIDKIEELMLSISRKGLWNADVLAQMARLIANALGAREATSEKLSLYIKLYGRTHIDRLNKVTRKVADILDMVYRNRITVIDLSIVETEIRRVIVKGILSKIWEVVVDSREPQNILVVIDEAHNYACDKGCYPSNAMIEKTLREGRKWGIGTLLASQRIIDFSPDIRNNINTVFFSKLQTPYDFQQLQNFIDLAGIGTETLSLLETREFFFAGLGNPLRYPMLVQVKMVGEPN